jgi:predicted ester cyclase
MISQHRCKLLQDFFTDVLNKRNIDQLADFVSPDFVFSPKLTGVPDTRAGFQQMLTILFIQYPDLTYTLDAIHAQGTRVDIEWTANASHPGGLIGKKGVIIRVGRRLCWHGRTTAIVRNGRIEALLMQQDDASLREQLVQMPDILTEN